MTTAFTIDGYRSLVQGLLDRGFAVSSFHDAKPISRHLILRHDIDQSIRIANALAEVETEQGWRSTWFVLVRTEMYNAFSRSNAASLRSMIAAGHEIGLHLDATHYDTQENIQQGAAVELRMLEDIVGVPVRIVSFHRPAQGLIGSTQTIAGRLHTYMPQFTRDMGYSSDSRGEWSHGHPWDHAAVREGRALQLLTHAIWWVGPDCRQRRERLTDALEEAMRVLDTELSDNNEVWRGGGYAPSEARIARKP